MGDFVRNVQFVLRTTDLRSFHSFAQAAEHFAILIKLTALVKHLRGNPQGSGVTLTTQIANARSAYQRLVARRVNGRAISNVHNVSVSP